MRDRKTKRVSRPAAGGQDQAIPDQIDRRSFFHLGAGFLAAATLLHSGCGDPEEQPDAETGELSRGLTGAVQFPYRLDPAAPPAQHGIALSSWLQPNRTALLLCDFQRVFADPDYMGGYAIQRLATVLPNARRLKRRFQARGWPIVHTMLCSLDGDWTFRDIPGIARKVLARDLRYARGPRAGQAFHLHIQEAATHIAPEIGQEVGDHIVYKQSSGVFNASTLSAKIVGPGAWDMQLHEGTGIHALLSRLGVTRLVCTGGMTNLCLSSTVRAAYDRGYLCTIAEDATVTYAAAAQQAEIATLGAGYAFVTTTQHILDHI